MKILIVHAHPEPHSFNASMTQKAGEALRRAGHEVAVSDLYAEGFDPVEAPRHYQNRENRDVFAPLGEQRHAYKGGTLAPDVTREIDRLEQTDLLILQFPLWWHGMPAILKGWMDRVFVSGGLYSSKMRYDAGYFRGKRALVSMTSGAPAQAFGPGARGGDPDTLLWPIHYSLHYMGFTVLPPFAAYGVQGHGYSYQSNDALGRHLQALLDDWAEHVTQIDNAKPLSFPGWQDWDADGRALR
jgi:NAD(P)H dehydrogenase (quinone)